MVMRANADWNLPKGDSVTWEQASFCVLLDIRAELRKLNRVMACPNLQAMPQLLRDIKRNTAKPRKKKAKGSR